MRVKEAQKAIENISKQAKQAGISINKVAKNMLNASEKLKIKANKHKL